MLDCVARILQTTYDTLKSTCLKKEMLDSSEEVDSQLEEEERLEPIIFISQDDSILNNEDNVSKDSLNHIENKLIDSNNHLKDDSVDSRKRVLSGDILSSTPSESIKRNRVSFDDLLKIDSDSSNNHVNGIEDISEEDIQSVPENHVTDNSDIAVESKISENGKNDHCQSDIATSSVVTDGLIEESSASTKENDVDFTSLTKKHLDELSSILHVAFVDAIKPSFSSINNCFTSLRKDVMQSISESDDLKNQLTLLQSSCNSVELKPKSKDNLKDCGVQTHKVEENSNNKSSKNSLPLPKDSDNNMGRQPTSQAPKGPPPHFSPKNTQNVNSPKPSEVDIKTANSTMGDIIDLTDEEERVPAGTTPKSLPGSLSNGNVPKGYQSMPNGYGRGQPTSNYSAPIRYQNPPVTRNPPIQVRPPPLPPVPFDGRQQLKSMVNPPILSFTKVHDGVSLQWDSPGSSAPREIVSEYEVYSYSCTDKNNLNSNQQQWKKIGQVQALPLPMACTLTQVDQSSTYFFAVRSLDSHNRYSEFSNIIQTN